MKKIFYTLPLALFLIVLSCGEKTKEDDNIEDRAYQLNTDEETGYHRMKQSESKDNIIYKGAEYHYSIQRTPCDSLSKIKDERGDVYVDNTITLQITRNGNQKVLSKVFTKQSFAAQVEKAFLANAILEGLVFDKVSDDGLVFAASVCYPQTDLFIPLSVTVSSGGNISIARVIMMDEEIPHSQDVE